MRHRNIGKHEPEIFLLVLRFLSSELLCDICGGGRNAESKSRRCTIIDSLLTGDMAHLHQRGIHD